MDALGPKLSSPSIHLNDVLTSPNYLVVHNILLSPSEHRASGLDTLLLWNQVLAKEHRSSPAHRIFLLLLRHELLSHDECDVYGSVASADPAYRIADCIEESQRWQSILDSGQPGRLLLSLEQLAQLEHLSDEQVEQRCAHMPLLDETACNILLQAAIWLHSHCSDVKLGPDPELVRKVKLARRTYTVAVPLQQPYDAPIFVLVQKADIDGIKMLLSTDQKLINAVDPFGLSVYYYATYYCLRHLGVKAAMQATATLLAFDHSHSASSWLDDIGSSPCNTLLDGLCVEYAKTGVSLELMPSAIQEVAEVFGFDDEKMWDDYLHSRAFPAAHRALLAFDACCHLEGRMSTVGLDLNAKDGAQRTVMAWAAEYRWAEAITLLHDLGMQADAVRVTDDDRMPLLHLAIAGPFETSMASSLTVRTLLAAGADARAQDHQCWTATHVAISWRLLDVVKILQRADDDTMVNDLKTADGFSSYDLACQAGATESELSSLCWAVQWWAGHKIKDL